MYYCPHKLTSSYNSMSNDILDLQNISVYLSYRVMWELCINQADLLLIICLSVGIFEQIFNYPSPALNPPPPLKPKNNVEILKKYSFQRGFESQVAEPQIVLIFCA